MIEQNRLYIYTIFFFTLVSQAFLNFYSQGSIFFKLSVVILGFVTIYKIVINYRESYYKYITNFCKINALFILIIFSLANAIFHQIKLPLDIASDLFFVSVIALFILALPKRSVNTHGFSLLCIGLVAISFFSFVFGTGASEEGRFYPPSSLAIAFALVWAVQGDSRVRRFVGLAAIALLILPIFLSGQRAIIGVFAVLLALTALTTGGMWMRMLNFGLIVVGTSLVLAVPLQTLKMSAEIIPGFEETRTYNLLERAVSAQTVLSDQSVRSRMYEARDVVAVMKNYANTQEILFGYGFGASYYPKDTISRNLTDSGTVHHIHAMIFMIFFRYGLLGLLIYGLYVIIVLGNILRITRNPFSYSLSEKTILFAAAADIMNGLVQNMFAKPVPLIVAALAIQLGYKATSSRLRSAENWRLGYHRAS